MKKLIAAAFTAALLLIVISAAAYYKDITEEDNRGSYVVALNEIEKLCGQDSAKAASAAAELKERISAEVSVKRPSVIPLMCVICIVFLAGVCLYFSLTIIKPFYRLSRFAENVARGELDIPLEYERTNYFGKFTWAFDSMRNEIKRARECEKEAIANNKTVIASLSHDIKTPVASIRAYAEALEMGIADSPEKAAGYAAVMMRKCDEVSKLTSDMLTHSLSDLDKLVMHPESFELFSFVEECVSELSPDKSSVFEKPLYTVDVYADRMRIAQVIENIISNAQKYAKSGVRITANRTEDAVILHFTDSGGGIPDEDMPFVKNRFYRGGNTDNESGAGLGLYIVNYIVSQSGGELKLANKNGGLEVTVSLPVNNSDSP